MKNQDLQNKKKNWVTPEISDQQFENSEGGPMSGLTEDTFNHSGAGGGGAGGAGGGADG